MADLPTRLDLFAIGRNYVAERAKRIDPFQVDVAGSDANLFVGAASFMAHAVVLQLGYSTARLTLDGALDEDLDRWAWDRYQETRKGAASALVDLDFWRATAAGGAGSLPVGTIIVTETGIQYSLVATVSFEAGALKSTGTAQAVQAGKAQQVGANMLRRFGKPGDVFDRSIQVNNPARAAGGEDREDDDTFKERLRGFWRAARRGVLGAIEFGARQQTGVVSASAIEAYSPVNGQPARVVNLYIADSSGVANAALARAVMQNLDEYRAGGVAVLVWPSMPQIVDVVLKLAFASNIDTVTLTDVVRKAVVEYVNSLPVNGVLRWGELNAVLTRYKDSGLVVADDAVQAPAGDLVPAAGQTLRTTLGNVKVTS